MCFNITHALLDGVSWGACLESLTNEPNWKVIGKQYKPSILEKLAGELLAPLGMLKVMLQVLTLPFENNIVKSDPITDKDRLLRVSDDINVEHFKKACKKKGATVTIGVYSLIGICI